MVAGNVAEVQWHPTQRVEWNEDKSAKFYVEVDGIREIAWWILGYGDQVKVVSPPALVKRVAETARRVVAKYEKKGE
jgi:proteasome accessory factor B